MSLSTWLNKLIRRFVITQHINCYWRSRNSREMIISHGKNKFAFFTRRGCRLATAIFFSMTKASRTEIRTVAYRCAKNILASRVCSFFSHECNSWITCITRFEFFDVLTCYEPIIIRSYQIITELDNQKVFKKNY